MEKYQPIIQDYLELNGDVADAVFAGCCWCTVIYRRATQRWQICNRSYSRYGHLTHKSVNSALRAHTARGVITRQEDQLSQRDRATLHVN